MTLPSCGEITGNPIGPAPEMRNVFAAAEIKDFADECSPPPLHFFSATLLAINFLPTAWKLFKNMENLTPAAYHRDFYPI